MDTAEDVGASIITLLLHYSTLRLLKAGRVNDVEQHGEEEIADQDREGGIHHRLSRSTADAHRAFARGQSFVTANENDEYPETERFRETHDDIAIPGPAHHVRHVVRAVNLE